jgi:hypothetical protein
VVIEMSADPPRRPRRFNLLILGPETRIGQSIIKKINDHFHFLNIAIPTGLYTGAVVLPPSQISFSLTDTEQLQLSFRLTEVVVACAPQYATSAVQQAATASSTTFVNACFSYPEAVICAACHRLPFRPTRMEATQSASGCSLPDLWVISHQFTPLRMPRQSETTKRWLIEQGTVSLETIGVVHSFEFASRFFAYAFWLFSMLLRFMYPFFSDRKPYSSTSHWWFSGRGLEHHQEYEFGAFAEAVDAETLRPDLALVKALDALEISKRECHDWGCCSKLKVNLRQYNLPKDPDKAAAAE